MARRSSSAPVVLIRNSERLTFKRCEWMWKWNFVDLLKPIEEGKALRFGDLIHQALERHYPPGIRRGPKPWLAFEKIYQEQLNDGMERFSMRGDEENWLDAQELGTAMLKGYHECYSERDKAFKVLATEQVFQVPIKVKMPNGPTRKVLVVGTMDGLWVPRTGTKKTRQPFIKEYKTTGSAISQVIAGLPMDEQAGTYWTFAPMWMWKKGILPEGVYPNHILYTLLRKQRPDERPENKLGQKLNKPTKAALVAEYERKGRKPPKPGTGSGKNGSVVVDDLIDDLGPRALLLGDVSEKQPSALFDRQPVYRDAADRKIMFERVQIEAVRMIQAREGITPVIKNPGPLYRQNCQGCPFKEPCELHESGNDYESMLRALYQTWQPYAAHEIPERW